MGWTLWPLGCRNKGQGKRSIKMTAVLFSEQRLNICTHIFTKMLFISTYINIIVTRVTINLAHTKICLHDNFQNVERAKIPVSSYSPYLNTRMYVILATASVERNTLVKNTKY